MVRKRRGHSSAERQKSTNQLQSSCFQVRDDTVLWFRTMATHFTCQALI